MKRIIIFLVAILSIIVSFGQNFEGEIVYKNSYKSKTPGMTDEQIATMMGSKEEYYIKNGNYKTVVNGSYAQWQLYVNKDNKLYNKIANSETLFWIDGASNTDEVLKVVINKAVTDILGYKCDEIILTTKTGVLKCYFNNTLKVDAKLFINHKYANWYAYLSKAHAMPLKAIIDNGQFLLEQTATEVKAMKLDDTFFELPANAKTMKSPQ